MVFIMPELRCPEHPLFSSQTSPKSMEAFLLDPSSLRTVLEMLTVIDSVEELAMLETLTPAQKRQVWDATPEATKVRVRQIRLNAILASSSDTNQATSVRQAVPPIQSQFATTEVGFETGCDADGLMDPIADRVTASDREREPGHGIAKTTDPAARLSTPAELTSVAASTLTVGDWVVLKGIPQLTRAELQAIWEVTDVQENDAQIVAKGLGTRTYPLTWMLIYPKPV